MPRELALYGLFIPTLLFAFLLSLGAIWLFDHFAVRHDWYRLVWHPSLFRLALFACIFGSLGLLLLALS